jgi:hypothetical protein
MSEREADETAQFGDVQRWSTDSEGDEEPITQTRLSLKKNKEKMGETKGNTEFIGTKVARDFGKQGIFFGEIVALEFDSGDEAKEDPFYVVKYTDGDQEDLDGKECLSPWSCTTKLLQKLEIMGFRLLAGLMMMKHMTLMTLCQAHQMMKKAMSHRRRYIYYLHPLLYFSPN